MQPGPACSAANAIATTVTDIYGNYNFLGLPDGTYYVGVNTATVPAGYTATTIHAGANIALDSGDPAGGNGGGERRPANLTSTSGSSRRPAPTASAATSGTITAWAADGRERREGRHRAESGGIKVCLYAERRHDADHLHLYGRQRQLQLPGRRNGSYVVKVDTTTLPSTTSPSAKDPDSTAPHGVQQRRPR